MLDKNTQLNQIKKYMQKISTKLFALTTFGLIVGLWFAWWLVGVRWVADTFTSAELERLGQVGDLFGGINALFAAFAFGGVAIAAYYQHKSWMLQDEQAAVARESAARLAFEPLFFRLLELMSNTRPTVLAMHETNMYEEKNYSMSELAERIRSDEHFNMLEWYDRLHERNQAVLGPYFRTLYHLLKLIYRSGLSDEEQADYANIVRAALSTDELLIIGLNCRRSTGFKLQSLILWYGLFKHVRREPSVDNDLARELGRASMLSFEDRLEYWKKPVNKLELERIQARLNSLKRPSLRG